MAGEDNGVLSKVLTHSAMPLEASYSTNPHEDSSALPLTPAEKSPMTDRFNL